MGAITAQSRTDRIQPLKETLRSRYSERLFHQRKDVFTRVFRNNVDTPPVTRTALALAAFLQEKDISVSENDLLAGNQQLYDFENPENDISISHGADDASILTQFKKGYEVGLFCGALGGHVIAGYHRVLRSGYGAMIETARRRLETCSDGERDFCKASLIVASAASAYAMRYAKLAKEKAEESADGAVRRSLERIALSCTHVATQPPRTFYEAVQLLWLTHEIITCEQRSGSLSLGRLDQVLYPFYKRDHESGDITEFEAQELIEALWLKFAETKRGFQNITLGGSDGNGVDLTNDLSFFFLRATRKLRMDQPLLSVRWHPGTPEQFWNEVEDLIQEGMGFPALFNENLVIEAKKRVGVSPSDAADWGIVGCVEPAIPGKEFSHTEGLRVNWAKVLELMLNGGTCTATGERFPLNEHRDISKIDTFDEFYAWYRGELDAAVSSGIRGMNILDRSFQYTSPYPFLSSTMDGCIEAGYDVTAGSTTYNFCTVNALGMANVADSLSAIKHAVFDREIVTLPELADAMRDDFAGKESLRQAVRQCPKYGNDQNDPDTIIRALCGDFHGTVTRFTNGRGGAMQCGLYSVDSHGPIGEKTGALPDGRHRGIALANALSPVQGSDTVGPTAVIKSCTKVDHLKAGNGMVLDLKFSPSFFSQIKEQGVFKSLVSTYFGRNGMEIQFNVIDRDTLMNAKDHPEDYQDLVVRVSGFSAYFVDLPSVVQEEIIARTEYAAI